MSKIRSNNQDDNRSTIKIIVNDISTYLYKSCFLSKYLFDKKQIELLDSNSKNEILDIFEFNRSITTDEASTKYSELLSTINSLFKTETQYTFDSLYHQYLEYTKTSIPLNSFLNCLIMLNHILNNYNELLNLGNKDEFMEKFNFEKKISLIEIDNIGNANSNNDSISSKLEKIYELFIKKPTYKDVKINKNLIVLIYVMTLNGNITIEREIPNLSNLIEKFSVYNKIYISNIYLSVLLYIQMVIIINLYTKSNKSRKNFLIYNETNSNHFYDFALNDSTTNPNISSTKNNNFANRTQLLSTGRGFKYNLNDDMTKTEENNPKENNYEIPSCYLFDDQIVNYPDNIGIKLILFQSYLKFFLFYYIGKNKIKFTLNLSIESTCEFVRHFMKKKGENKKGDEVTEIVIFENMDKDTLEKLSLKDINLLTKENITNFFSSFNFKEFLIKLMDFDSHNQIETINNKYIDLISKSNNCYFQEPVTSLITNKYNIKNKAYNFAENLSIQDLFMQYKILCSYLDFYHKNKEFKKAPKSVIIKFNTFKCILNRENKKIQIFFNFSSIKEKTLFHYLKLSSNLLKLEKKYEEIITYLKEYKLYDSTIRLYQTNFRSHQVSFYFSLITKKVFDFIEENKYHKISILEAKFSNFNPNMQVYIKDDNVKLRNRINIIRQMIVNASYYNKIMVLNNYLEELSQYWNLVVISDKESDFKLLRTFEDNKIFFYLSKNVSNINSYSSENSMQINTTSVSSSNMSKEETNNDGYEYLNVIMYFKNDEDIFVNGIQFIDNLEDDKNSILEYKTTLICDRFYLESNVLIEPRMKRTVKIMYNVIDDLLMIAKNIKVDNKSNENDDDQLDNDQDKEYYNYDVYIANDFIAVSNYHLYDVKEDKNYSRVIFEFLSILSSCVELILYILKNKDIYISKFVYLIRSTKDDYYIFEYKNSNMFIKKVKEFDSLINLNVKQCYPLFCFISKKTETKYTISNDNFYDVFLRLFLNLNKVVDTKEKLNEIFLQKVHKNIFYEYYDSFILIAFSFEAYNFFSDFLMTNDYLNITKGEKFDKCYIVLTEEVARKKNYKLLLDSIKEKNDLITKKIIIFNFNFKPSYYFSHKKLFFMSYRKAEYLINEEINRIKTKTIPRLNTNLCIISKVFSQKNLEKDKRQKIMDKIKQFMVGEEKISIYDSQSSDFENIMKDYNKEKVKIRTQKVEMRVYQLTEEAKNTQNNNLKNKKKDCLIF